MRAGGVESPEAIIYSRKNMISNWTDEEIENILIQLNNISLPFEKYDFVVNKKRLNELGHGGFAKVYEAGLRKKHRKVPSNSYAIKVIGFGDNPANSAEFKQVVEAQKNAALFRDDFVKIYDYTELYISFDENDKIINAIKVPKDKIGTPGNEFKNDNGVINNSANNGDVTNTDGENKLSGLRRSLKLQFVVMEKLEPVFYRDKSRKPHLYPKKLADFDRSEILKLAYEIGQAVSYIHEKNFLHRDIKLENIMYDNKKGCYKLGDFGVAKATKDGMASTLWFTRGYGAPEVTIDEEDKYDNTADIYSFGMVIYLLISELRFPSSDNYEVNVGMQYSDGYVLPCQTTKFEDIYGMTAKMCAFDPDDRYQSMEDVLNTLDGFMVNKNLSYQREHKQSSFVLGTALLFLGVIAGKLSVWADWTLDMSLWAYIVVALTFMKGVYGLLKKETMLISFGILVSGSVLIYQTGFSVWKLLLLLMVLLSDGEMELQISGAVILFHGMTLLNMNHNYMAMLSIHDYRWVGIALLSLAAVMIVQYIILGLRDVKVTKMYFKNNRYWVLIFFMYVTCILYGYTFRTTNLSLFKIFFNVDSLRGIASDLNKIGITGALYSVVWLVREKVILFFKSKFRFFE